MGLLWRLAAVLAVIAAAIGVRELLLEADPTASETRGARLIDYELDSRLLDETLPVTVVVPPGARTGRRSLLVFLHGRGEDERSYLDEEMFAALVRQGEDAPLVAFPRGGEDSYWHDRESGRWGSYLREELVPELVKRFEIEPERIAIGGISMGGFGAVENARQGPVRLASGRLAPFCAVGGHSPAVWLDASETAPGAFDDAEDFQQHDVIDAVGPPAAPLAGVAYRIDVGDEDPFAEAAEALADQLDAGGAEGRFLLGEGEHDAAYWRERWRPYMSFYARALERCADESKSSGRRSNRARAEREADAESAADGEANGG